MLDRRFESQRPEVVRLEIGLHCIYDEGINMRFVANQIAICFYRIEKPKMFIGIFIAFFADEATDLG